MYADRLTGWLEVAQLAEGTASCTIRDELRRYFMRWGATEQLATDGGTNLVSAEMCQFYERWGVQLRVSSAQYPQSNGRAEAAVKSANRTLRDNIAADGSLDSDQVSVAILQYLNTPLRGIDKSPAELAMGRQLRGGVPTAKRNLRVSKTWCAALRGRERQMADQCDKLEATHRAARTYPPIAVGHRVRLFNVAAGVWDRTGVVVEARRYSQYLIRLDGSGRMTVRTRKHVRPCARQLEVDEDLGSPSTPVSPERAHEAALRAAEYTGSTPDGGVRTQPPADSACMPATPVRPRSRQRRPPGWLRDYVRYDD